MQKRNVVFVLGFLSFLAVAVRAAGQTPQAESPTWEPLVSKQAQSPTKARVDTLLKGISLSPEQQPQVDSIIAIYVDQLPATLPVAGADSIGRERMVALFDRLDTEVRMVLTPPQQAVFDKNKEEWRRRAGVRST